MRKLIIAPIALLFVAALVLALGMPLLNGGTPAYAHVGDTNCSGGAHLAFGLGVGGSSNADAGSGFGELTASFAVVGVIPDAVAGQHLVGCSNTGP